MADEARDETLSVSASAETGRPRLRRVVLVVERMLAVGGLVCLLAYVSACAQGSWFQHLQARSFERGLEAMLADDRYDQQEWSEERVRRFAESSGEETQALGRLRIPSAGISVMVVDGTDDATLDRAVGRIEGTAQPGEIGNLGIAGHRDGFFRGLRHVREGDALSFASREGIAHYTIEALSIVEPAAVEVLEPTDEAVITLVTCYPFYYVGAAPERFIVRARQTGFEPWSRDALARFREAPTRTVLAKGVEAQP